MLILKVILVSIGVLVLAFFANQNSAYVSIYYGPQEPVEFPLFFVIYAAFVIGMIVVWLISFYEKIKVKGQLRGLRKEKKQMEGELNSLRRMPIVEGQKQTVAPVKQDEPEKGNE